jgi:hypothetical protein
MVPAHVKTVRYQVALLSRFSHSNSETPRRINQKLSCSILLEAIPNEKATMNSSSDISTSTSTKNKTVQWNKKCQVREYKYKDSSSNKEQDGVVDDATWYTLPDFFEFKDERNVTIRLIKHLGLKYVESLPYSTTRGLESCIMVTSTPALLQKTDRRRKAINVVLEEQQQSSLRKEGIGANDDSSLERLAQLYADACIESVAEAHARGQQYCKEEKGETPSKRSKNSKASLLVLNDLAFFNNAMSLVKLGRKLEKRSLCQPTPPSA